MAILNRRVVPDSNSINSEQNFRRLENDIRMIVRNYPSATVLRPSELKLSTYAVCLRSAMAAFINSTWASDIDRDKVLLVRSEFEVQPNAVMNTVTVGPRKRQMMRNEIKQASTHMTINSVIDALDEEILHAVCVLKNRNLLPGEIKLINLTNAEAFRLSEQYFNLMVDRQPDGLAVLI